MTPVVTHSCPSLKLWEARRDATLNVRELNDHYDVIMQLGPDGMSSDEAESDGDTVRYRVLKHTWRAPELTPWLRVFDAAYRLDRMKPVAQRQGASPRIRYYTNLVSVSLKVPQGLPRNAYNPEWLSSLLPLYRDRLRIRNEDYHFHHLPDLSE